MQLFWFCKCISKVAIAEEWCVESRRDNEWIKRLSRTNWEDTIEIVSGYLLISILHSHPYIEASADSFSALLHCPLSLRYFCYYSHIFGCLIPSARIVSAFSQQLGAHSPQNFTLWTIFDSAMARILPLLCILSSLPIHNCGNLLETIFDDGHFVVEIIERNINEFASVPESKVLFVSFSLHFYLWKCFK